MRQFGQSLWSIVTTLAEKNRLSFAEMQRLFGNPAGSRAFNRKEQRSLHSLVGFNHVKIGQLLSDVSVPIGSTETSPYQFGCRELGDEFRYCPKCVAEGFHSPIHQVPGNFGCLWHYDPLDTGCPTCGIPVPFDLDRDLARNPNRCTNGHRILRSRRSVTIPELDELQDRAPLNAYLSAVQAANSFVASDGNQRIRSLLSTPPQQEQLPLFARRLGIRGRGLEAVLKTTSWPSKVCSTSYLHRIRGNKNMSFSDRDRLLSIRKDPADAVHRLFNDYWLENEFRDSVNQVVERLRKTVLSGHQSCWSMADNDRLTSVDAGLSCIWMTAFKLWRICHSDCLYRTKRRVDDRHPYVAAWTDIANRFVANPSHGWKRCVDMSAFMFLVRKYTEHSMQSSFWAILMHLKASILAKESHCFEGLVQSATKVRPLSTYVCKRSPQSDNLVLWVDDQFGKMEKIPRYRQGRAYGCTDVPGDLRRWAVAESYGISG